MLNFFKSPFNYLFFILFIVLFSSCSDVSKSDIHGSFGDSNDWYFEFDTTINLKKYWPKSEIPESLDQLLSNSKGWDGMVFCKKSTGDAGVGLWKLRGKTEWGSSEIDIYWQKSGLLNLNFYRNGDWYFKNDFGKVYFTAGKQSYETKSTTWQKIKSN